MTTHVVYGRSKKNSYCLCRKRLGAWAREESIYITRRQFKSAEQYLIDVLNECGIHLTLYLIVEL